MLLVGFCREALEDVKNCISVDRNCCEDRGRSVFLVAYISTISYPDQDAALGKKSAVCSIQGTRNTNDTAKPPDDLPTH